jgi:glycosyltransferase involved in cell wall biosynthesis
MVTLDILIPTTAARTQALARLLAVLAPQIEDYPAARIVVDPGSDRIGPKRRRMIEEAQAKYIVFVDDDDLVATNYVACIISALQSQPDCVGLSMYLKRDGVPWSPNPVFRHSLKYRKNTAWSGNNRTPHHLCPVRREIALKARFGDKDYGEDYDYALAILPHLKTEAMAAEHPIYLYDYRSKPACGC